MTQVLFHHMCLNSQIPGSQQKETSRKHLPALKISPIHRYWQMDAINAPGRVETLAFGKHLDEIVACVDLFKLAIKVNLHSGRVN